MKRIRVGHLYPDYLNIYADRGNIAVFANRALWRGIGLQVDLKRRGVEEAVVGALRRHGVLDRSWVSGFDAAALRRVAQLEPDFLHHRQHLLA